MPEPGKRWSRAVKGIRFRAIAARPWQDVPGRRYGAAVIGALTFMISRNPWTWSGVTEVYALNLVLLTWPVAVCRPRCSWDWES